VHAEVIVIGAGPTGLMLATELALAGVAVSVVERETAPSGQSRGGGVNPRTAEVLALRGLVDALAAHALPRHGEGLDVAPAPPVEAVLEPPDRIPAGPSRS
jgi:2-polyprenyl-6-methoxyphenol hydroxylase-like FAD-dependent oxidoreductase